MSQPSLSTLSLNLEQGVAEVRLNRPDKSNAMTDAMWLEIRQAFAWVDATPKSGSRSSPVKAGIFAPASISPCSPTFSGAPPTPTAPAVVKRCAA